MTAMASEVRRAPRRASQGNRLVVGLVKGGLVGSQIALVLAVGLALAVGGPLAAANAAIASAITIVFFASGQGVQVVATELANGTGLVIAVVSFTLRAGALGVLLWLAMNSGTTEELVHPTGLLLGALLTTMGWVGGVLWVGRRQRVAVYDTEYVPPVGWDA